MKRLQHITIQTQEEDTLSPFELIEFVGTGLALYRVFDALWNEDKYFLVHIASRSRLVSEYVTTFVQACIWIRSVKGLTDWTQPSDMLKTRRDLEGKVLSARLGTPVFLITYTGPALRMKREPEWEVLEEQAPRPARERK